MARLFTHSRLKLWIWIVIIAAASIVLLCLLILGWWCFTRRKRVKNKSLPNPVLAPTRKVTIRRGRMVSSSRHLSLTGSKFGLGQFMNIEEKDHGEKSRNHSRNQSRSPFMWWLSTQDRSQSRQSQMSSQPQMDDVQGQCYQKPEPVFYNSHARKESAVSDYSLPSIINGKELAEDARVNPLFATEPSGSPPSSRYINFSRAFSPLRQSTLRSTSAPNVLSQIVESSPRQSTVSKNPSMISAREVVQEDVSVSLSQPTPVLRPLQTSRSVPDHLSGTPSERNMAPRFSFATQTSLSHSAVELSRTQSVQKMSHLPASPRSGPLPRGKVHVKASTPTLHTIQSVPDKPFPSEANEVENQPTSSTNDDSSYTRSVAYWESRPDLQPVRKLSKKGNVLRKKSLRRAEIVSMVGN